MTEGMKAFAKRYHRSLDDPKLRDLYELDLSARRDQAAIAYTAEMKGRNAQQDETIRTMLANGIPVDIVYRSFNAPRCEIDAAINTLRAKNQS